MEYKVEKEVSREGGRGKDGRVERWRRRWSRKWRRTWSKWSRGSVPWPRCVLEWSVDFPLCCSRVKWRKGGKEGGTEGQTAIKEEEEEGRKGW